MEKLEKKINDLLSSLSKKESMFVMSADENDSFGYSYYMSTRDIGAGIATILSDWFDDDDDAAKGAAEGIMAGLLLVMETDTKASREIKNLICSFLRDQIKKDLERLKSVLLDDDDDKDTEDEDEDCEHCENMRKCNLEPAIKYRKKNHIPSPNKQKSDKCKGKKQD